MNTIKFVRLALVALVCVAQLGFAQQRKAGLTGAAFLKVGVGARAVAMGSAVTAMPQDVNQIFWNPAGIALKDESMQATFNYNKWFADLNHMSAAVSYNLENIGTVGFGLVTFGKTGIEADRDVYEDPNLQLLQIDHNTSSTYDYADMAAQLSFSRYVIDNLALGITVKYVSQSIDGESVSAVAVDFGSVYHIGVMDWTIAARFNNLGSDMKFYDIAYGLPLTFAVGTAMSPYKGEMGKLTLAVDAVKPQDGPQYFFSGAEYSLMDMISIRGGYKINYLNTDDGGTSSRAAINSTVEGFSGGFGLCTSIAGYNLRVDYAYTQMEIVEAAHRISITVGLK